MIVDLVELLSKRKICFGLRCRDGLRDKFSGIRFI